MRQSDIFVSNWRQEHSFLYLQFHVFLHVIIIYSSIYRFHLGKEPRDGTIFYLLFAFSTKPISIHCRNSAECIVITALLIAEHIFSAAESLCKTDIVANEYRERNSAHFRPRGVGSRAERSRTRRPEVPRLLSKFFAYPFRKGQIGFCELNALGDDVEPVFLCLPYSGKGAMPPKRSKALFSNSNDSSSYTSLSSDLYRRSES